MSAQAKLKTPLTRAARARSPPSNWTISLGNTGTMMPSASMSSTTQMKTKTKVAFLIS